MKEHSANPVEELVDEVKKLSASVEERVVTVEKAQTDYRNDLSNLNEQIRSWKETGVPVNKETVHEAFNEMQDKQQAEHVKTRTALDSFKTNKIAVPDVWKSGISISDYIEQDEVSVKSLLEGGRKGFDKLMSMPPLDEHHKNMLRLATEVKIADSLARLTKRDGAAYKFTESFPKLSRFWGKMIGEYARSYGVELGVKAAGDEALDRTSESEWVPTGWSSEIRELVSLELRVAGLFERITMPQNPYILPVDMTDDLGDIIVELTSAGQAGDNPWDDTKLQSVVAHNVTFTATKLRARFVTSQELEEDSIVPILPLLRRKLVMTLANSLETGIINGTKLGTTHIDTDTEALGDEDVRKAWNGLRAYAAAQSFETDGGDTSPSVAMVNAMRRSMGEYGADPAKLAALMSITTYVNLLDETQVQTVDKLGPNATILSGQLAQIYGIPVIVSRYWRDDLDATGVNGATGNTFTSFGLVFRPGWMIGDRRAITIESERLINTDQTNLVSFQRLDFQNVYATAVAKVFWQTFEVKLT